MSEEKIHRRFELLNILEQICEREKKNTIPLRGLVDIIVLLKYLYCKFDDFSFLLINNNWYSPEILDDINDLYNFGYINVESSIGNVEKNREICYNISLNKEINKAKVNTDSTSHQENSRIISKLSNMALNNTLHEDLVHIINKGNGHINSGIEELKNSGESHSLVKMLYEVINEPDTTTPPTI